MFNLNALKVLGVQMNRLMVVQRMGDLTTLQVMAPPTQASPLQPKTQIADFNKLMGYHFFETSCFSHPKVWLKMFNVFRR